MAVIGKIRKQSGLLIILIGVAMVLFLLSDFLTGKAGILNQRKFVIGEMAGEDVDQLDFETRVDQILNERYGPDGASDQVRKGIRESVWQQLISERIVMPQFEKLGIAVSPTELLDQIKNTQPGSLLYQYFTDQNTGQIYEQFQDPMTGGLNSDKVMQYVQSVLNSEDASKQWLPLEEAIKKDVAMRKYTTMLVKGLTATTSEAQAVINEKNTAFNLKVALKEFISVPDEQIEVTEDDMKAYYDAHKMDKLFQNDEERRDLQVLIVSVTPTDEDVQAIKGELEKLKSPFANDSNDTAFIAEYSDSPDSKMIAYFKPEQLIDDIKDTLMKEKIGTIVGPYEQGRSIQITKLVKIELAPDSVKASHILIKIEDSDTNKIAKAKAKLDSLMTVAKSKKNFAELASEYSEDLGSKVQGGDLDWFTRGRMVPEFEKACFDGKKGDMEIVESQYGVHLINITDQSAPKKRYLLASVDRLIEPSKSTADKAYKETSKLYSENTTLEKFMTIGEPYHIRLAAGIKDGDETVAGMQNCREIVRWAYDASVGDVSEPFELENKFVIAALASIKEEGTISYESAKDILKPEVIKQKKAEKFIAEFGSYNTIDEAAKNVGVQVMTADGVHFSDAALPGGIGQENILTGTVAAMSKDQISKPIIGSRGVFVVQVTGINQESNARDLADEKNQRSSEYSGQIEQRAVDALKKAVGLKDNRNKFY